MAGGARGRYRIDCGRLLDGVGGMVLRASIVVDGGIVLNNWIDPPRL